MNIEFWIILLRILNYGNEDKWRSDRVLGRFNFSEGSLERVGSWWGECGWGGYV